jgi:AcrR family transcriptional regulator
MSCADAWATERLREPQKGLPMSPTKTATPAKPAKPRAQRAQRTHDAAATMQCIVDAAIRLLAESGFTALGINSLSAAAGVDKKLIYYHFGGLDGVVRKLGERLELWLGTPLEPRSGEPYGEAVYRLLMEYGNALRGNALVLRLLAWELVEPNEALKELEVTRSAAMVPWVQTLRAAASPVPQGIDAPAVNAVLLAGLHYLALREQSVGSFAGVDLSTPEGARRIADAMRLITARTYATPHAGTPARKRSSS